MLELFIFAQFVVIVLLLVANHKLRQRPDFRVVQELQQQAINEKKRADGLQSKHYSVGANGLFLDGKKAIDADKLTILLAKSIEQGEGIAGSKPNVIQLLLVIDSELEDYPEHMNHVEYRNGTNDALWVGKVTKIPDSLRKLMED